MTHSVLELGTEEEEKEVAEREEGEVGEEEKEVAEGEDREDEGGGE